MMTWSGKHVCVVGLGQSNQALTRYLVDKGAAVTARDQKTATQLGQSFADLAQLGIDFQLGDDYLDGIEDCDTLFLTPGIRKDLPQIQRARAKGVPISTETVLFFDRCQAPIIGITGSSGKTTTTSLIAAILEAQGHQVFVGGNIGRPLIEYVDTIPSRAWVVLELSSFQLEMLDRSPEIAVVTNISPNHLDFHDTMEAYIAAKSRIYTAQSEDDLLVLNWDDSCLRSVEAHSRAKVAWFSRREEPEDGGSVSGGRIMVSRTAPSGRSTVDLCAEKDIKLLGKHNLENVLAACTVGHFAGVTAGTMRDVITSFTGAPHRLELVKESKGVRFFNDSIATTPARSIAGLNSFDQPVWLIAGGYDKKLPFDDFADTVLGKARGVFLLGQAAKAIEEAVLEAADRAGVRGPDLIHCRSLESAVIGAYERAEAGDVILLSPACASFDMFDNFESRGEQFRKTVHELTEAVADRRHDQVHHGI